MNEENERLAQGVAASGVALRQAREARGLSLIEVAHTLKLTIRQIEAIENETFDLLPGVAFARGFVRNYARFLGLDPAPLLERLDLPAQLKDARLAPESNAEGAVPREPSGYRSQSPMPAVLALIVLLLVFLAAWHFDLAHLIGSRPAARSPAPAAASEPLFPPHTDETAVVTAQTEPMASAPEPASAPAPAPVTASAPSASASAAPAAAASATPADSAVANVPALHFAFAQDAWVEVRDATGKIVFSQLNKAGSSQEVLGKPPFSLVIGNAANVTLEFNGRPVDLAPHTKVTVARLTLK